MRNGSGHVPSLTRNKGPDASDGRRGDAFEAADTGHRRACTTWAAAVSRTAKPSRMAAPRPPGAATEKRRASRPRSDRVRLSSGATCSARFRRRSRSCGGPPDGRASTSHGAWGSQIQHRNLRCRSPRRGASRSVLRVGGRPHSVWTAAPNGCPLRHPGTPARQPQRPQRVVERGQRAGEADGPGFPGHRHGGHRRQMAEAGKVTRVPHPGSWPVVNRARRAISRRGLAVMARGA